MKKTLMCATAVTALAGSSLVAQAEDGWYGRADIGIVGESSKLDHDAEAGIPFTLGGNSEVDNGLLGSLGVGYAFGNGFRLETALTHRDADLSPTGGINGTGFPASTSTLIYSEHGDGDLQAWDLMVNVLYDFNRDSNFQPYLGAGVGAMQIDASSRNIAAVQTDGSGTVIGGPFGANGFNDSETGLALQALAGVGIGVTDRLTLDLGLRALNIQDLDFTGVNEVGSAVSYQADYTDYSATGGLRYAFGARPPPPPPPP
ncbi:MAG: porin family protein, partial [Henriciella sp.]|nr:porin family protein [Henriciella sp.]